MWDSRLFYYSICYTPALSREFTACRVKGPHWSGPFQAGATNLIRRSLRLASKLQVGPVFPENTPTRVIVPNITTSDVGREDVHAVDPLAGPPLGPARALSSQYPWASPALVAGGWTCAAPERPAPKGRS